MTSWPGGQQVDGVPRGPVRADVVIIGGGIVGLASAWHLARDGRHVALVEAGLPGGGTGAAAGMLTPGCEWHEWMPRGFLELLRRGRDYYPEFLAMLDGGPARAGYRDADYLLLDVRERDEDTAAQRCAALQAAGLTAIPLGLRETACHEPGISLDAVRGSLLVTGDALVDPRALQDAVRAGAIAAGAWYVPERAVRIGDDGRCFTALTSGGWRVSGERIVLAAGAWTAEAAQMLDLSIPVAPVRGQMIELHGPPGALGRVLFMAAGGCGSILERYPGVYIVGTSEERTSGEPVTTPAVITAILARACAVLPALRQMSIAAMWAGFRPVAPDELPMIGAERSGRVIVATGHYRNGILLGPLTGRIVADLVAGRPPGTDLSPYRPGRSCRAHYRFAARY